MKQEVASCRKATAASRCFRNPKPSTAVMITNVHFKMEAMRTCSIAQMQLLLGTPEISKTGYEVN